MRLLKTFAIWIVIIVGGWMAFTLYPSVGKIGQLALVIGGISAATLGVYSLGGKLFK